MYAKYVYLNTATLDEITADIGAIFTGETNPANLSASCDTANTEVLTAFSTSPWVEWDDQISASDQYVMRLEMSDDSGVYKYVNLRHNNGDDIAFTVMESWDNVGHTPTNEIPVDYIYTGQKVELSNGGTMHLYASQFALVMMHQDSSNIFGGQANDDTYGSSMVLECTRDHPSLTTGAGGMPNYFTAPSHMFWAGDNTQKAYFWKGRDNTDTVQTPMTALLAYPGRDFTYNNSYTFASGLGSSTALEGIGEPARFGLLPILVGGHVNNGNFQAKNYMGDVSARCDIWFMGQGSAGVLERVNVNGYAYITFKAGHTDAGAGNTLGGKFIVPYG